MIAFPIRFLRLLAAPALLGFMLCGGGCSDVITYARDSREKGLTYYNQRDYDNAAGAFRNAIRQDPADYYSHYYLASCYDHGKAYHQAIQQYKTCLRVLEHSLAAKDDIAFRMKVLDDLGGAIAKCDDRSVETASISDGSHKVEDLFLRAKVGRLTGDADGAIEAYDQAILLEPRNFYIAKEYGLYLEQLGQTERAGKVLRQAYASATGANTRDQQVADALRRVGVVPGPGLKDEKDLVHPVIPEGPIPTVDVTKLRFPGTGGGQSSNGGSSASTDQTPRD